MHHMNLPVNKFLSTLSLRRATPLLATLAAGLRISIHALLAESDRTWTYERLEVPDFYPRSPCGERRMIPADLLDDVKISIHALLAESDSSNNS